MKRASGAFGALILVACGSPSRPLPPPSPAPSSAPDAAAPPAPARDQCFRAVVAASAPIRAWFEEATGARGEPSTGTMVPPRGPICAKKGESLRLVFDAPPDATVRAVVFTSP